MSSVVKMIASPIMSILSPPKVPKTQIAPVAQTPRESASAAADRLSRRRGSETNQRSGMGGAEASTGKKSKLGA